MSAPSAVVAPPQATGGRRRPHRHLVQVVLAVVVVAGGLLVEHVESQTVSVRPFVSVGQPGDVVPVGPGAVIVHGARSADGLDDGWGELLTTSGTWVAVDLSVVGRDGEADLAEVFLEDAQGRQFAASDRVSLNSLGVAQPGSPVRGELLFEVPRDAVGEMTLVAQELLSQTLSGIARVPVQVQPVQGPLVRADTRLGDPL